MVMFLENDGSIIQGAPDPPNELFVTSADNSALTVRVQSPGTQIIDHVLHCTISTVIWCYSVMGIVHTGASIGSVLFLLFSNSETKQIYLRG